MKNTLLIIAISLTVVCKASALKDSYIPVKLIFKNGKVLKGFSEVPGASDSRITFKETQKGEKTTLESSLFKRMVLYFPDENDSVEFDRMKTYNTTGKKIYDESWLVVLVRGYATLYFTKNMGTTSMSSGGGMSTTSSDKIWFCYRKGEEAATIISVVMGSIGANGTFKVRGAEYFSDCPEVKEKVEKKVYTYKNIEEAAKAYNACNRKK